MPTAPSASWVAECAACHHSNPARAHFCSVCGAPLHSPAAAATKAAAGNAAAQDPAASDLPEPKGFMLHFNDDNTLAIAPRYTARDAGEAELDGPGAAAHAASPQPRPSAGAAAPHAEFRFSLPGTEHPDAAQAQLPAPAARSGNWSTATVAGAMLALTALVGTGSYLLGRSSADGHALSGAEGAQSAMQPAVATAAALGSVSGTGVAPLAAVPVVPRLPVTSTPPPSGDSLAQAQQALALADAATGRSAVAPVAPALSARAPAPTLPAAATAAPAARAPAPVPCNPTVAALALCER